MFEKQYWNKLFTASHGSDIDKYKIMNGDEILVIDIDWDSYSQNNNIFVMSYVKTNFLSITLLFNIINSKD